MHSYLISLQLLYNMNLQAPSFPLLTTDGLPAQSVDVLMPVIDMLNSPQIDKDFLRKFLRLDIFESAPLVREQLWKVVLGYLPSDRTKWGQQVAKHEKFYQEYLQQFVSGEKQQSHDTNEDPPRSDHSLWRKIQKDTYRTQPELSFFKQPAPPLFPSLPSLQIHTEQKQTRRYNYMTRILFIFAKLNPLVQYVQGMNEILAPIFYIVNHHKQTIQEASCFFMFANVMADIIAFHIRSYDNSENVFHARMQRITHMIMVVDMGTWERLELLDIDPFLYLFRWVTLLFAQEFPLHQTLRIWESIFSYKDRTPFVDAFCLALIISCKEIIAHGSFAEVLSHLRGIRSHVNLDDIIIQARQYCESDPERWSVTFQYEDEGQGVENNHERKWMPGFFQQFL